MSCVNFIRSYYVKNSPWTFLIKSVYYIFFFFCFLFILSTDKSIFIPFFFIYSFLLFFFFYFFKKLFEIEKLIRISLTVLLNCATCCELNFMSLNRIFKFLHPSWFYRNLTSKVSEEYYHSFHFFVKNVCFFSKNFYFVVKISIFPSLMRREFNEMWKRNVGIARI